MYIHKSSNLINHVNRMKFQKKEFTNRPNFVLPAEINQIFHTIHDLRDLFKKPTIIRKPQDKMCTLNFLNKDKKNLPANTSHIF